MRAALRFLAGHAWAGVGLALLAELVILVALSLAPPSTTIGIPAAVAAATAGTVAVVFGVADGVVVATAGAIVFAALGGWGAGQLAAIGVWPLIVAAVGLFAQRVERHRIALRHVVEAQESERRALALTLHDDSAQTLTGALLTLRAALPAGEAAAGEAAQARELITDTIRQLRRIARELSPRALEDYGLAAALGHLTETESTPGDVAVAFEPCWDGRLSLEAEQALFRFAQAAVAAARAQGADGIGIRLAPERGRVALTVTGRLPSADTPAPQLPAAVAERLRLLDGRVSTTVTDGRGLILRADLPGRLRLVERAV
jgi:signal transduction histidine kinase